MNHNLSTNQTAEQHSCTLQEPSTVNRHADFLLLLLLLRLRRRLRRRRRRRRRRRYPVLMFVSPTLSLCVFADINRETNEGETSGATETMIR